MEFIHGIFTKMNAQKQATEFRALNYTLSKIQACGRLRHCYIFSSSATKFSLCGTKLEPMPYRDMNEFLRGYLMCLKNQV